MEINLIDTAVQAYADLAQMTKKTQIAMESVVPDTREDIGRILSVCPEICLKSKEWNGHGATVTGETALAVMYINERGDGVSYLKTSQTFSVDFDCPFADEEPQIQLSWQIGPIQTRAVNPRKISADYEIRTEITVSRPFSLPVSQALPEELKTPVHLQTQGKDLVRLLSVCERSFSVNEQLAFPEGASKPAEIVSRDIDYRIHEQEIVGSRLLIKGSAGCRLVYFPEGEQIPAVQSFSVPFSQLIDLGTEEAKHAQVRIEETSDYLDLIETIEGQKLLNLELHAVAQVRAFDRQSVSWISDAYCNAMPCVCRYEDLNLAAETQQRAVELHGEEDLELPEEYSELIGVFPLLTSSTQEQAAVTADLLCRSKDGKLFPMKRSVTLAAEQTVGPLGRVSCRITGTDTREDGNRLCLRMTALAEGTEEAFETVRRVVGLDLDEEKLFDTSALPSITAVWPHNETVWELAKMYHSSPESIREMNADVTARPIFIPKQL